VQVGNGYNYLTLDTRKILGTHKNQVSYLTKFKNLRDTIVKCKLVSCVFSTTKHGFAFSKINPLMPPETFCGL
jgi:hypothetical protein